MEKYLEESVEVTKDQEFSILYDKERFNKIAMEKEFTEEGYKKGIKEGYQKKSQEAAINLYKNGVSKDLISKSLNITKEELEEYLKEVK